MMQVPPQVNHAPRGQHRPWEALGSTPQHCMHVAMARWDKDTLDTSRNNYVFADEFVGISSMRRRIRGYLVCGTLDF